MLRNFNITVLFLRAWSEDLYGISDKRDEYLGLAMKVAANPLGGNFRLRRVPLDEQAN